MPTNTKQESRRSTAEGIVREFYASGQLSERLVMDIEAALKERDERAAKIGDEYIADMRSVKQRTEYGEGCLNAAIYITAAMRNGDTNA